MANETISWFKRGKPLILIISIVLASIAAIFGTQFAYSNYYQPYVRVYVAQVDPKLFEPWPPNAEFVTLPQESLDAMPKLKAAFSKVNEEFERIVSECPTNEAVYCDLESNTRVEYDTTRNELESLLRSHYLNFYETKLEAEWIAFVTDDSCYDVIAFVSPDELAATYGNGSNKCYFTIFLAVID